MSNTPVVRNAADESQVRQGKNRELRLREQEIADLRYVLAEKEGRRFLWRLMSRCKAFGSVWEPSAKIHYNAGQQDIGHYVMAEIMAADEQAFLTMMRESKGEQNV
jgi:hypothetical protein